VSLQDVCQKIEDAAQDGDAQTVGLLLPQLKEELTAAMEWLRGGATGPVTPST
jgi:hypothetical protein